MWLVSSMVERRVRPETEVRFLNLPLLEVSMSRFVQGQLVRILNFDDHKYRTQSEINCFGEYGIVDIVGTQRMSIKSNQDRLITWVFSQSNIELAKHDGVQKPRRQPKGMTLRGAHLIIGRRSNFRYSSDPEVRAAARTLIGFYKAKGYEGRRIPYGNMLRRAFVYADGYLRQGKKIK